MHWDCRVLQSSDTPRPLGPTSANTTHHTRTTGGTRTGHPVSMTRPQHRHPQCWPRLPAASPGPARRNLARSRQQRDDRSGGEPPSTVIVSAKSPQLPLSHLVPHHRHQCGSTPLAGQRTVDEVGGTVQQHHSASVSGVSDRRLRVLTTLSAQVYCVPISVNRAASIAVSHRCHLSRDPHVSPPTPRRRVPEQPTDACRHRVVNPSRVSCKSRPSANPSRLITCLSG